MLLFTHTALFVDRSAELAAKPRQTLQNLAPYSDSFVWASRPLSLTQSVPRSPSAPGTCVPYTL